MSRLEGSHKIDKRVAPGELVACARMTDKVYTDENLLGTWGAIDALPSYGSAASQLASQEMVAPGQIVSLPVTTNKRKEIEKPIANIGECHILSLPVAMSQNVENGGSGGARTRNLCRDRAAL